MTPAHRGSHAPRVLALRRYPVKSMGGESLPCVDLDTRGITGDRWFAVEDANGHFASGKRTRRFRRHDEVFGYRATTLADGGVQVTAGGEVWQVGDPRLDDHLSRAFGIPVRVTPERDVLHQDAGAVSLVGTATLQWCASELGVDADPRRLRVNILVDTREPFIEESWLGTNLTVGDAVLRVVARTQRCRMIDIAQDGAPAGRRWLKPLGTHREVKIGVYADVVRVGAVRVGDAVRCTGVQYDGAVPFA